MTTHHCFRVLTSVLFAIALARPSTSQEDPTERQSEGPFLGAPFAFSVAAGSLETPSGAPIPVDELRFKPEGVFASTPTIYTPLAPGAPDYTSAAILAGATPLPDIDAFSIGLDWVVSDPSGIAKVPSDGWAALTFSVTASSLGERDSRLRAEVRASAEAAGADMFSYVIPGSRVPAEFVDMLQRGSDSTEIAIDSAIPNARELDALDLFVSLVWQQNPDLVPLLLPDLATPRAFFSVTTASLASIPTSWWSGSTPSGATVFATEWTGAAWTTPTPFLLPSQLGLSTTDEVDALALDWQRRRVLFSTDRPDLDEILYAEGFPPTLPQLTFPPLPIFIYRVPTPRPREVSRRLGLARRDGIDALCALDPSMRPPEALSIGRPEDHGVATTPTTLVATAFRAIDPATGQAHLTVRLTGWPAAGRAPGNAMFFMSMQPPVGPAQLGMPIGGGPRNPASPFGGDPVGVDYPIPPMTVGSGIPLWFTGGGDGWHLDRDLASGPGGAVNSAGTGESIDAGRCSRR